MRARSGLVAVALTSLTACGGGGPATPPALAYALPTSTTVVYAVGDTSNLDIDAGGENMQARTTGRSTLAAAFARGGDGLQVSLEVTDLDGRVTTPISSASADENGIDGPLVLSLDRRGAATIVSRPAVTTEASQFFSSVGLASSFFPRLPGRAAQVGEQWTDTITFDGPQGPGRLKGVNILTYIVAGDTVVDGHSVVKLEVSGMSETQESGDIAGMDYSQALKGSLEGWVLFDMARHLLVASRMDGDMRGSMDVSAAPFPLGVRVRSRDWVKLQDSM